jgi:hypothetical protein
MAVDFHRTFVNDESFIRGAARILYANITVAFPTKIGDVINMSTYEPMTGWVDLGATKNGITITVNSTEESFDVDQIFGELFALPTNWECAVQTNLAEMTVDRLAIAWEGSAVTTDSGPSTGSEKEMGFGVPQSYTQRRLAVGFQRPNGKIRLYMFRKVQRASVESSVQYAKTGEQQTVPVRFRALADSSIADPYKRFFLIRDQV